MNRLSREKSPYLLQHADNPVDWYPWGEEAFARARREDRPVFLSVGYSTCHWCHVMAHESFADPTVAALLNRVFVNIKVDREERPDIDHVFMTACQLLTGGGGWPLTIVMTPDKKPVFAATYLPKHSRHGRPGLLDIATQIDRLWREERDKVLSSGEEIIAALHQVNRPAAGSLEAGIVHRCYRELRGGYDRDYGGFGTAPKFPVAHNLLFLLRYGRLPAASDALAMVDATLTAMRRGGIYDHVGHGFHRYATDRQWLLPHFEKMLYDQAMLACAYAEAASPTGNDAHLRTAADILGYVVQVLKRPEGGFACGEDADSEGEEGKFYLWTETELRRLLSPDEFDLLARTSRISPAGNFRDEASGRTTGANIIARLAPDDEAAGNFATDGEAERQFAAICARLAAQRAKRVRPHLDDKVLTDWNGMLIAALARVGHLAGNRNFVEQAAATANFLLDRRPLMHRWRDGQWAVDGFLDDYAFLAWGLLELYGATFDLGWLKQAAELAETTIDRFFDSASATMWLSAPATVDTAVPARLLHDSATPSGNSCAYLVLRRLARLTGNRRFEETAHALGGGMAGEAAANPSAHAFFLAAACDELFPVTDIAMVDTGSGERDALIEVIRAFAPADSTVALLRDTDRQGLAAVAPRLARLETVSGLSTVHVCRDRTCLEPVTDPDRLALLLRQQSEFRP
ncbi:MAG: thioredoxin domain-containing protein [Thermodesulfobacteriota bacterium]